MEGEGGRGIRYTGHSLRANDSVPSQLVVGNCMIWNDDYHVIGQSACNIETFHLVRRIFVLKVGWSSDALFINVSYR